MSSRRLRREFKDRPYEIIDTRRVTFEHRGHRIVAHLSPDYPFKAPTTLFIDGVEMTHAYFNDRPKAVMDELSMSGCCYMCRSYLCSDNWSPSLTLDNVVNQMLGYQRAIRQAHYSVYVRKSGMLPLPDDTVNQVLDFL